MHGVHHHGLLHGTYVQRIRATARLRCTHATKTNNNRLEAIYEQIVLVTNAAGNRDI
jgi:hypothetical protein